MNDLCLTPDEASRIRRSVSSDAYRISEDIFEVIQDQIQAFETATPDDLVPLAFLTLPNKLPILLRSVTFFHPELLLIEGVASQSPSPDSSAEVHNVLIHVSQLVLDLRRFHVNPMNQQKRV